MLKNAFYPTVFMTVALLVFALLVVTPALAVTFTVNSTLDQPDDLTQRDGWQNVPAADTEVKI